MRYTVEVSRPALHKIGEIYYFLREGNPRSADLWLAGLYETFATLRTLPNRGRPSPESPQRGRIVREVLYQKYWVKYVVSDGRVLITAVRHSAFPPDDGE